MRRAARIAVIGGGIGGLAAARALRQRGFEPRVYEAAPELKEVGAGVALHPNAMNALRALDVEGPVRAVAWESDYQVVRDGCSGRILTRTPQRGYLERRFGATGCTVHRADLLDMLAAGLPARTVQLGARCVSVETNADGARARFADGTDIEADVVIGADGIHSAVRASLVGPDAPAALPGCTTTTPDRRPHSCTPALTAAQAANDLSSDASSMAGGTRATLRRA